MRSLGESGKSAEVRRSTPRRLSGNEDGGDSIAGAYHEGTGTYVSARAPSIEAGVTSAGEQGYTLNLVDAPIKAAAKSVLGDTLGLNFVVDPRVVGVMSLHTSSPVSRGDLVDLFETSLAVSGASVVRRGQVYQIVPSTDALATSPAVSIPAMAPRGPGVSVQVIELSYIGAEEMRAILEPISRQGSILKADSSKNTIIISGTGQELKAMRDAISVFDVDWMKGRSVALQPLKNAKPGPVAAELQSIFGNSEKENGVVRFVANERMNAVLIIASRPVYLKRAVAWIRQLDQVAPTDGDQMFVYEIQNRPAKELAEVLQAVLADEEGVKSPAGVGPSVAPDLREASFSSDGTQGGDQGNGDGVAAVESVSSSNASDQNRRSPQVPAVVADIENNALLISTTARNYKRIEQLLHQLDALPIQVMLEAVIAEVRLNDELKFGLRWAVESGAFRFNLSDAAGGFAGASLPGSAFSFVSDNIQITLNALASITDVNIVSSPTIMALNNQKATLQVGDQVPIVTQQATGTASGNAPVVNSVELKDTGLILNVTPRINAAGRVLLDIDQEVSNVVKTTTSGIDSPTIQQRRLRTKVIVNDGESIALGGLIQERNSLERSQVPIIGNIPVVGNLFKNKTDTISRTELIIFIRPRVVRNVAESREVTAEFRQKLQFNSALTARRKGKTELQRDLNRLKY